MNAPATLEPPSALVVDALERLALVAQAAGHAENVLPYVPVSANRLEEAVALARLERGEALVVALLLAVECDASLARSVAALQAPVGGARVLAGLAASLFAAEGVSVAGLWSCRAVGAGLVAWGEEAAPLPERTMSMPPWIASALAGYVSLPPGVAELCEPCVELPPRVSEAALAHARMLKQQRRDDKPLLVIRTPCTAEGEAMARALAGPAGFETCALCDPPAAGLSIWLSLLKRIPVLHRNAGPGETIDIGPFDSLESPLIVIAGHHGEVASVRTRTEWRAEVPTEAERSKLWSGWGLEDSQAEAAALRYRHGTGRIAEIGRELAKNGTPSLEGVAAAMMSGGGKIDGLTRRSSSSVRREDIVLPPSLGHALERLRDRILLRNHLQDGLGPTIRSSYRPGVRALFSGESGTGKTLAAQWLAREAGLPCYRVDLAALTSKWIGETEKNLSSLFDAAEHSDVLLFFDEADSLFGARTEVSDAHDRHANAQTNFLLQRIEEFDGVALLATNGRNRFDPAFVRRLDAVLEFPLPDAPARRKLWDCHLGEGHDVSVRRLDRLAAEIDLAGGHVRNVVLAASARARAEGRPIRSADLDAAIAEEYAKLGRSAPSLPLS